MHIFKCRVVIRTLLSARTATPQYSVLPKREVDPPQRRISSVYWVEAYCDWREEIRTLMSTRTATLQYYLPCIVEVEVEVSSAQKRQLRRVFRIIVSRVGKRRNE